MCVAPDPSTDDIVIRLLEASEANRVIDAITAAYGETYDVPWCYDATEISRRIAHGQLVSAADVSVASDHGRELLDYVLGDLP